MQIQQTYSPNSINKVWSREKSTHVFAARLTAPETREFRAVPALQTICPCSTHEFWRHSLITQMCTLVCNEMQFCLSKPFALKYCEHTNHLAELNLDILATSKALLLIRFDQWRSPRTYSQHVWPLQKLANAVRCRSCKQFARARCMGCGDAQW